MADSPKKSLLDDGFPDYAVRREKLMGFFDPPVGKTTFHDLVHRGKVVPVDGLKGYYLLNESLVRLGMKPVQDLPRADLPTIEDLVRLALWLIEPDLFILPWRFQSALPDLSTTEGRYVVELVVRHAVEIRQLPTDQERIAYGDGVLAATLLDSQ